MADISQIQIGSTTYNLKDTTARSAIDNITVETVSTSVTPSSDTTIRSGETMDRTATISHDGTYLGIVGWYMQCSSFLAMVSFRGVLVSGGVTLHYHVVNRADTGQVWKAGANSSYVRSLWFNK